MLVAVVIAILAVSTGLALALALREYRARLEAQAEARTREALRTEGLEAHRRLVEAIASDAEGEASRTSGEIAQALRLEIDAHRGDSREQTVARLRYRIAQAEAERARILGDGRDQ